VSAGGGSTARPPAATRSRASVAVELVPVALVVVAEAAWISVLGGLFEAVATRPPVLGIPAFAGFVLAGLVAARLLGRRLGSRWPIAALGLVGIAAVAGWLASDAARTALCEGLGPSLAAHPAGLLAGLAVLRGFPHARLPLPEDTVSRLLSVGVPGLAVLAVVGGTTLEPYRSQFLAETLAAAIVFIVAATLAPALARLAAVGDGSGFDWRRNPTWLGLTVAVLAVGIAAAIGISTEAGAIQTVAFLAIGALVIAAMIAGFDRGIIRVVATLVVGMIAFYVLVSGTGTSSRPPRLPGAGSGSADQGSVAEGVATAGLGGFLLFAAAVGVIVLAAIWMRRTRPPAEDLVEESRTIDRGDDADRPHGRRRRFGRRPEPTGAASAYVALVEDLDRYPGVRRAPAETPAEHAARLRAAGHATLSLDLLAADYALVRFGAVELSTREDRRAVARWRVLRRRIPKERA
jgi:hypothetical protein